MPPISPPAYAARPIVVYLAAEAVGLGHLQVEGREHPGLVPMKCLAVDKRQGGGWLTRFEWPDGVQFYLVGTGEHDYTPGRTYTLTLAGA
jgi:hypothetical protein